MNAMSAAVDARFLPAGRGVVGGPRSASVDARFRRRRTVAAAVVVLVAAGAILVVPRALHAVTPDAVPGASLLPVAQSTYVVQPGDTLWRIARSVQPSGDVRPLVQQLVAQRGGAALRTGERVVLPRAP